VAGISINEGTQSNVATDKIGSVNYQVVKLDVGAAGVSSAFTGSLTNVAVLNAGTVTSLANMVKGTVTRVEGGTIGNLSTGTINAIASGTITAGTVAVDKYSYHFADAFGTTIQVSVNTLGTIKAAVAGSAIYITDIVISVGTATNLVIGDGVVSKPVIGTLYLNTNGGMVGNFVNYPHTSAGSALVYQQSVAGPLTITCNGYVD
jgi:hypothetical protein